MVKIKQYRLLLFKCLNWTRLGGGPRLILFLLLRKCCFYSIYSSWTKFFISSIILKFFINKQTHPGGAMLSVIPCEKSCPIYVVCGGNLLYIKFPTRKVDFKVEYLYLLYRINSRIQLHMSNIQSTKQ